MLYLYMGLAAILLGENSAAVVAGYHAGFLIRAFDENIHENGQNRWIRQWWKRKFYRITTQSLKWPGDVYEGILVYSNVIIRVEILTVQNNSAVVSPINDLLKCTQTIWEWHFDRRRCVVSAVQFCPLVVVRGVAEFILWGGRAQGLPVFKHVNSFGWLIVD